MTKKIKFFVRKHGVIMTLAIIVPGGEIGLLGYWLFKKFKNKKSVEQEPLEITEVA